MRSLRAKSLAAVAGVVLVVLVVWVTMNVPFWEGDVSADNRSTCSGIPPYTTGGVRVVPTLPPWCFGGPQP